MNNILFVTIVFSLLLISCDSTEWEEAKTNEILRIPIDSATMPNSYVQKCANFGNGDLLYYWNYPSHEILIFDLNSTSLRHRISLQKEGPDAIENVVGFTILSQEEIIVADRYPKLHLINIHGETIRKIDYTIDDGSVNFSKMATISSGSSYQDVYRLGNRLIIPQDPSFRSGEGFVFKDNERAKSKLFVEVDLEGQNPHFLDIALPDGFFDGKPPSQPVRLNTAFTGDRIVWTFNTGMDIYYSSDLDEVEVMKIDLGIKSPNANIDPMTLGPFEANASLDSYGGLLYDPYRKKYYRMFRYGVEGDARKDLPVEHLASHPNKFSIFVLNEDFEVEREVKFTGVKYDYRQYFLSSKGFFLSLNNPLNPEFDENYLRFERIAL